MGVGTGISKACRTGLSSIISIHRIKSPVNEWLVGEKCWGWSLLRVVCHSLEAWGLRVVCFCFLDEQDDDVRF